MAKVNTTRRAPIEWDYHTFGERLRRARVARLPIISQDKIAEVMGVKTQAKVSRWEHERPNSEPPELHQILKLADFLGWDGIETARLCGRWDDDLQERILVSLASRRAIPRLLNSPRKVVQPIPLLPIGKAA